MTLVRHTVSMNLASIEAKYIKEMSNLVEGLSKNPAFGIVDCSGIVPAHNNADMKAGFNRGYTHFFEMLFLTSANRDYYLPHSEHMDIVGKMIELGFSAKPEDFCTLDSDAIFNHEIEEIFFRIFEERHKISIAESFDLIDDESLSAKAKAAFKET